MEAMSSPSKPGNAWNGPVSGNEANRRAGGRRAINTRRQFLAIERRVEVARLLDDLGFGWGAQAEIARILGVHRSTVSRDMRRLVEPLEPEAT